MPSNTYFSGAASDWTEHIKDYSTTQDGISSWDQVLTGLQQNLELQTQAIQTSTDYDISQAYANYLQNQRQISQASNLGTGFKEQLESNLQSSYQSAFQQAQVNETQELYNVAQAYQDELINVENQFAERGKTLSGLSNRVFEYLETYGGSIPGYEKINWAGNLEEQGVYTRDENNDLVLTEKGSNALSYALLNRLPVDETSSISFEEWLGNTYSDDLEAYRQNYDILRSGFGIAPGTTSLDTEQYESSTERINIEEQIDRASKYQNTFTTENITEILNRNGEKGLELEVKSSLEDIFNISDENAITVSRGTIFNNSISGPMISTFLNIKSPLDSINKSILGTDPMPNTESVAPVKVKIDSSVLTTFEKNQLLRLGASESNGKLSFQLGPISYSNIISYADFYSKLGSSDFIIMSQKSLNIPTTAGGGGAGGGGIGTF